MALAVPENIPILDIAFEYMRNASTSKPFCWWPGRLFLLLGMLAMGFAGLNAQVVDEDIPQLSSYEGVGEDSLDFIAQSFFADIRQVHTIGAWLERRSGNGRVKLALAGDAGGQPDFNNVFYESPLISPASSGQFYYDSTFITLLEPSQKYWLVVDGFNNLVATGYSAIGVGNQSTDTGESLRFSADGGQTWDSLPGVRMAIYVEGDTCVFPVQTQPIAAVVCPTNPATISATFGYASYLWSTGETSQSIEVQTSGVYTVTVVDEDFCVGFGEISVIPDLVPSLSLDSAYQFCEGESVDLIVPFFYSSYQWNNGSTDFFINVEEPGFYWVEATSSGGCIGRDTTFVEELEAAQITLGSDTSLCEGESVQYDAGPGYQSYQWSTGATTRSIFVSSDDSVYVTVLDQRGCRGYSDSLLVEVFPQPDTPSISLDIGNLVSSFGFSYQWYQDGVLLPNATGQTIFDPSPGAYQVLVSNGFGCSAWSDTLVIVGETPGNFIPSGFSPNGDGVNDFFEIEAIDRFPGNTLTVISRWGEEVYRMEGYQNNWDGTGKGGSPLPDGNYFYVLDLGDGDPPRRGTVLINR